MKIVVVESIGISSEVAQRYAQHFETAGHEFVFFADRKEDEPTLIERAKDADIMVVSNIKISKNVIDACPKLKMISVAFTGVDHIDINTCRERGIVVCNAAGYSTTAVSELAIGLMIDVYRRISEFNSTIRQQQGRNGFAGLELKGKTVGVVGTGAIGCEMARLLQAFGCKVLAYSRTRKDNGLTYVDLDTLLKQSDIVTLHVPLTQETHHLIDARAISLMKPSAVLINTARGNVVDIPALAQALKEHRLAGAGVDVYETEPPLAADHVLLSAPNVVMVPHVGFATQEALLDRADIVFNNIDGYFSGKLLNVIC